MNELGLNMFGTRIVLTITTVRIYGELKLTNSHNVLIVKSPETRRLVLGKD